MHNGTAWQENGRPPTNLETALSYRREADRLRNLAAALAFSDVRDALLRLAREYETMANHREILQRRQFGEPPIA